MKFKLSSASYDVKAHDIEVNTLEDLRDISEKYDCPSLVIDFLDSKIIIYDDYLE